MNHTFSRRAMFEVGAVGSALNLSEYLRLHAADPSSPPKRSAIFLFLEGAPSHQDTFDIKPNAPLEGRQLRDRPRDNA